MGAKNKITKTAELGVNSEGTTDWNPWDDEDFLDELDRCMKSLESGEEKGVSWEEVKAKANSITRPQH